MVRFPNLYLLACLALPLFAQEPTVVSSKALEGSKQDPAAVDHGGKVFGTYCAGCHGVAGKGGPGAPDLIRSVLVLDDEKGILIGPVIREGRPDKGMPKLGLTEAQIADVVAWLHVRTFAAGHRNTYTFQNIVTGDPRKGESYFQTTCAGCHSADKDLAGIGKKYDALSLQTKWLQPRSGRDRRLQIAISMPGGQMFNGTLDYIDDFNVTMHDDKGGFHSFTRNGDTPAIKITDPLQAHSNLLAKYTDADIHNLTAYLVTLK